jgi:hypothetical protein
MQLLFSGVISDVSFDMEYLCQDIGQFAGVQEAIAKPWLGWFRSAHAKLVFFLFSSFLFLSPARGTIDVYICEVGFYLGFKEVCMD